MLLRHSQVWAAALYSRTEPPVRVTRRYHSPQTGCMRGLPGNGPRKAGTISINDTYATSHKMWPGPYLSNPSCYARRQKCKCMNDVETQQRFVFLRAEGWSFARIAEDLQVSKPTLIKWSRKFQFDIQNQRAIIVESL